MDPNELAQLRLKKQQEQAMKTQQEKLAGKEKSPSTQEQEDMNKSMPTLGELFSLHEKKKAASVDTDSDEETMFSIFQWSVGESISTFGMHSAYGANSTVGNSSFDGRRLHRGQTSSSAEKGDSSSTMRHSSQTELSGTVHTAKAANLERTKSRRYSVHKIIEEESKSNRSTNKIFSSSDEHSKNEKKKKLKKDINHRRRSESLPPKEDRYHRRSRRSSRDGDEMSDASDSRRKSMRRSHSVAVVNHRSQ
jgi:hypothetical protein